MRWTGLQIVELAVVYLALIIVGLLVFIRLPFFSNNLPLGHVIFPFLLWLALRFHPQEVSGVIPFKVGGNHELIKTGSSS